MLRTKHKQNCSFESQSSYSHSVTLASLSSHSPSSSHPHSVILCHTVIYFPIRTVSLCHTVLYLPIHTVSLSVITVLQLPIHTVSLSAITQSCIFKKSIHTVSLSVVIQSLSSHSHCFTLSSHSPLSFHSHCFTLSSHSPSSSHPHCLTLCHHICIYIFQFTQCHSLSSQSFIFPFTKCHSLSSHSHSFSHLYSVTVIKGVSSLSLCISFLKLFLVCSHSQ